MQFSCMKFFRDLVVRRGGRRKGIILQVIMTPIGILPNETVSSKNWEAYNLGLHSTLITRFHLTQAFTKKTRAAQASQNHLVNSVG